MDLRIKRAAVVVLVNSILIVLGIAIAELVLGAWVRPNGLNRLNLVRSRTIKFNIEGLYEWPAKIITYSRDNHGLRGSFHDPSEIDILTVGGSTTDQRFIGDGHTWQDVMQQRLEEMGRTMVVANAGVDGQSTYGHIKNFDWWFPDIPGLKPECILFYVGANDFHVKDGSHFDALIADDRGKSLRQILGERSVIYHASRTIHGAYVARFTYKLGHLARDFAEAEWTAAPLRQSYDEIMEKPLREFAERLTILIRKTREFGSTPVFVTQPTRWYRFTDGMIEGLATTRPYADVRINGVDHYYMMRMLDDVMISACEKENVRCLDMAREITWEDDDFYDFTHMTPKGARKVGEYLADKLMRISPGFSDTR